MLLNIDGAKIHVDQKGSGEPVIFLHGVPDSAKLWTSVIDEAAQHYACYAPDLPGFNRSELPGSFVFDLDHYGAFVYRLLQALEIDEPVTLVLHDWGGIFGMSFACQYPEKVKRIICGSFPFSHLYKWHIWARIWQTPVLGELSMILMNKLMFNKEIRRGSRKLDQAHIDDLYVQNRQLLTKRTVLKLYRSAKPRYFLKFQNRLKQLSNQVPIHTVWGKEDPYVPSLFADMLHPKQKSLVEGVGHWVPAEAPEEFCAALMNN